jgi:TonB family protein
MSEMAQHGNAFDATERRRHSRHQTASLSYLDIGPDNGGIILNISEGGVAVQAMGVLPAEPVITLRIQLPKSTKRLAARGKIAWTSGSKKEAGVEFVDLPEEVRGQLKDWLSSEASLQAAVGANSAGDLAPAQPLPAPPFRAAATPLPTEPAIAQVPAPAESILAKATDSLAADVEPVLTFGPPARELEPRMSRRVVSACVVLVVVCIGLGIAIGRSAFEPPPNTASSGNGVPLAGSSPAATQPQNTSSAAPPDSGAHNRTDSRDNQPTQERSSPAMRSARPRVGIEASTPPSAAPAGGNAHAATIGSERDNGAATPAEASPVSNHAAVSPIPPTPAPDSRGSLPLAHDEAPATQQSPDRLVPSHLIYSFYPVYPQDALQRKIEGTVIIHATVGRDGRVGNLRVVSGPALLTAAALDAAQYWRYIPALRNGEPYETEQDISIDFQLPH